MASSNEEIAAELTKKDIRPSFQRVRILAYMRDNLCHPTVERIFNDLQSEIPSLSRTTIYNTMALFEEKGLIKPLNIDESEIRYDIVMKPHGHFKCDECGAVFNFRVDMEKLDEADLGGFMINDRSVYFKGICSNCLKKIKKEE